jgi:hypothetical protein
MAAALAAALGVGMVVAIADIRIIGAEGLSLSFR